MVFSGTDPEYSVEGYLIAVTANFEYRPRTSKNTTPSKMDT